MAKYIKKPVAIDATQWYVNGDHPRDGDPSTEGNIVRYYRHPADDGQRVCDHCGAIMHEHGWINTFEGGHVVCPGDYIITGVEGERYPCKPDIFYVTYYTEAEYAALMCRPCFERKGETMGQSGTDT